MTDWPKYCPSEVLIWLVTEVRGPHETWIKLAKAACQYLLYHAFKAQQSTSTVVSVGLSVGRFVGKAFVRWSIRRTILAYLALINRATQLENLVINVGLSISQQLCFLFVILSLWKFGNREKSVVTENAGERQKDRERETERERENWIELNLMVH